MALDERYRWVISDGVQGPDGRPKHIGIGIGIDIDNAAVVINTHGYAALNDDAGDLFEASFKAAKKIAQQRRRS